MASSQRVPELGRRERRKREVRERILYVAQVRGDVRTDHSIQFLTEMVVGGFGTVMNNWVNSVDYSVKDRLAQAAAFLGEAVSPATIGNRAKGDE